jgi:galactokinase
MSTLQRGRRLVCSAPGRAGIIGNPTDMYGGSVLSSSVPMRARAILTSASDLVLETHGQQCLIRSRRDLNPRGDHFDIARAVLDYLRLPPIACHVRYETDIPLRSGLAGSTALVVALLQSLLAWQG